jgi:hypothetical protein
MLKDVFLSYASDDKAFAHRLCETLEHRGIACWIAPRDIAPGSGFDEAIVDAIDSAQALVLVLSGHANESPFVINEVNRAFAKGKTIFPFRIEDVLPSKALQLYLARHQWTDAFPPPVEEKVDRLAAAVMALLGKAPPGTRQPIAPTTATLLAGVEPGAPRMEPPPAKVEVVPSRPSVAPGLPVPNASISAETLSNLVGKDQRCEEFQALRQKLGGEPAVNKFDDCSYESWKDKGVSFAFNQTGVMIGIFLYSEGADQYRQFAGELPGNLSFSDSRAKVREQLGQPASVFEGAALRLSLDEYKDQGFTVAYNSEHPGDMQCSVVRITLTKPFVKSKQPALPVAGQEMTPSAVQKESASRPPSFVPDPRLKDNNWETRKKAIEEIAAGNLRHYEDALKRMAVKDNDLEVCVAAFEALDQWGIPFDFTPWLQSDLTKAIDPDKPDVKKGLRTVAIQVIKERDLRQYAETLKRMAQKKYGTALSVLDDWDIPFEDFGPWLRDGFWVVRWQGVQEVGKRDLRQFEKSIKAMAKSDDNPSVLRESLKVLDSWDVPFEDFGGWLHHSSYTIQEEAINRVGRQDLRGFEATLKGLAYSKGFVMPEVRSAALRVLGQWGVEPP